MKRYRVYEAVNNDGKTFRDIDDNIESLSMARKISFQGQLTRPFSTFIVNYINKDKSVTEEYFGEWRKRK